MTLLNGIQIKTPTKQDIGIFRVTSNAKRTASGRMTMELIAIKRRIDLQYELISTQQLKLILDTLASKTFHTYTYPDPQKGENAEIVVYPGDINFSTWQKLNERYWRNVSLSLIEQ